MTTPQSPVSAHEVGEKREPEYEDQIVCPYCGDVDYDCTDYPDELKQDGDSAIVTCGNCGKDHNVIISVSIAYLSGRIGSLGWTEAQWATQ